MSRIHHKSKSKLSTRDSILSLRTGSIILLIVVFSPYLLFIYQYLPDTTTWETPLFTIKSGIFPSIVHLGHAFFSKLVPLILLLIWFIDSKSWWHHAIIVPISSYVFQIVSVLNDSAQYFDTIEFAYSIPVTSVVLTLLYLIRQKMGYYVSAIALSEEIREKEDSLDKRWENYQHYLKYK